MPILPLTLIVEDRLGEAVARKMLDSAGSGYRVEMALRWNKDTIRARIGSINQSARGFPYFVLTDQDTRDRCPPRAIDELRVAVHPNLLYRFAVMEIESWILAHREAISRFLFVPLNRIPDNTDTISQPKEFLISLAKKSRSSAIRRDIAPRNNSTARIGPGYNDTLSSFVTRHWDVGAAIDASPSLERTFRRLRSFQPSEIFSEKEKI